MRGARPEVSAAELAISGSPSDSIGEAYADAVGVALLATTADGGVLGHNRALVDSWQLPTDVLQSKTVAAIASYLEREDDEIPRAVAELLRGGSSDSSGEIASSDGRTLAWRKVELSGERGYVWAFEDESATRQMAAALVDAANWLQMLELHTNCVLLELDASARIVGIWGSCRAFFDEQDATLQGKRLAEAVGGADGAMVDACVRRVISTGAPEEHEYAKHVHGQRRVFTANAALMPAGDDYSRRATVMLRDITDRANMQAQLLQAERLASIGLLAAGVAHEINNPLAFVLLSLQRVRAGLVGLRDREGLEVRQLLDDMDTSLEGVNRVQAIVRDLNQFSRSDNDDRVPVDVHRALEFAIGMAQPQTAPRARLARDFGNVPYVRASESRLSQLFLNLIVNAAHAIPEGSPEENEIRVVTRTDARGRAVIEVRDTGHGISPAALERIFEPFYTTKPRGLGTGLGLTICNSIATALNGRIDVESDEGRGSLFRVLLPPIGEHRSTI